MEFISENFDKKPLKEKLIYCFKNILNDENSDRKIIGSCSKLCSNIIILKKSEEKKINLNFFQNCQKMISRNKKLALINSNIVSDEYDVILEDKE